MEKVVAATVVMISVLTITAMIVEYVKWMVDHDIDNAFTILGPIVFLLWLLLVFTF